MTLRGALLGLAGGAAVGASAGILRLLTRRTCDPALDDARAAAHAAADRLRAAAAAARERHSVGAG